MQIYTGKDRVKVRKTNQGSGVVEDLVKELENTGRNLTCDNIFRSLGFTRKLLSKKTTLAGIIRKNRVELPSAFTNGKEKGFYDPILLSQEKIYCHTYEYNALSAIN
ncbi:Hypothetical predicted protein [Octopus vulgaris]|uniref:PiggyBac transposable element-derived protein domain-containing protein n=1 Tax=Octopus vulgaris TaxID=6645 RepID=A0AA36FBE1_OCTVU|nr:Hypothetical predicted protein [Octopus vulgaris]